MQTAQTSNTPAIADLLMQQAADQAGKTIETSDDDASREEVAPVDVDETALDAQPGNDAEGQQFESEETETTEDALAADESVSLDDLAEMLDVPTKEIYSVSIPIGGDASASLGELKDAFKWKQKFDGEESEFREQQQQQQNEIMVARRQTEDLVNILISKGRIGPQDLTELEGIQQARAVRENQALIKAIPSWRDPAVRQADFNDIVELAAEYGFNEAEIRNTPDHRALKILFDMTAARRHRNKRKDPPKNLGGQKRKQIRPGATLAARKAEAKQKGGATKRALISDMLTGKVEV